MKLSIWWPVRRKGLARDRARVRVGYPGEGVLPGQGPSNWS
jgi:hypothetical protein